jgi:hypothetical protein
VLQAVQDDEERLQSEDLQQAPFPIRDGILVELRRLRPVMYIRARMTK